MKKSELLNSEISYIISKMGHTDMIVIGDCGLPIPETIKRIDIALKRGLPNFLDTLQTVLDELVVEEVTIANEMQKENQQIYQEISKTFQNIKINSIPHEDFKKLTHHCVACIRTGEASPYANIILKSGVIF
ncbi:MAG: D-ribose pyranase [Spirochaetes bacterium]|nr:D-ribose pyranase [Spirochaetota bacterium]